MSQILLVESDKLKLREYLKVVLSTGIHNISFIKKDGSTRLLKGTRDPDIIGAELFESFINPPLKKDGTPRVESTTSLPTFDTDINQWRSFSMLDLVEIDGININTILEQAQINIEG